MASLFFPLLSMFHSVRSLFSGALLSVLLVTSIPSADAFSFDSFSRVFAKMRGRDHVSTESKFSASGSVVLPARCKSYTGDNRERCEEIFEMRTASGKIMTHGEFTSAMRRDRDEKDEKHDRDEDRSKKTVVEVETRVMKVLRRSIDASVKAIRKACKQNNTDATLVTQCLASAKTRFQTGVSIMIDTAFSVN